MNTHDKALEIRAAVTAVIAFGTALFGWVGWAVVIWVVAMLLDYLTGTAAAVSKGKWSGSAARSGLWHKLGSIAAVCVAALCDIALGIVSDGLGTALPSDGGLIAPVVVLWYIFTELGSIVENAAELGAPVPGFLRKAVASIRNAAEGKGEQ